MGKFVLDELESDEIHAALVERRADLSKRAENLVKDSLPEAAEGVRQRLRLYDAHNGPNKESRPGLVRMFAPQRDIETEADQARRSEQRDANGGADLFGGGVETGGRTKGKNGKKDTPAPTANASVPADDAGGEVIDVDYEIIPEGRRIGSKATITVESALAILSQIARVLLAGPEFLADPEFENYAAAVVAVFPAMNPDVDADHVEAAVMEEIRDTKDNARGLAHYIERNVALIRDKIDNPIAKKSAGAAAEDGAMADTTGDTADDTTKSTDPLDDGSADALRRVVFPNASAPAADTATDTGLTFETRDPKPDTTTATGETKDATTPAATGSTDAPKKKGKGGGKKKAGK